MKERIDAIIQEKEKQGLSDHQISEMCQLSVSTVSRTLTGKTEPTEHTIHTLETVLGIAGAPTDESAEKDPALQQYISMLMTEKDREIAEERRWIIFLVILCLVFVVFAFVLLIMDVSNLGTGWIREQK